MTVSGLGGKQRKLGTLLVFFGDGSIKARLKDADSGYLAFISSHTFQGLLEAVERGLSGGGLEWKEDRYSKR